jgi:hypothetical protein
LVNLTFAKLKIKQNLSKSSDAQVQFSTQLKALELKFDADWEPLKKLNASFELDGKAPVLSKYKHHHLRIVVANN